MATMQSRTERTRRLTLSAMFATLALIFTYVEVLIPYNLGIPGVKLGLANLVILIALYRMDVRYALMIDLIRILLAGLMFSGLFAMLYSLAGGMISLLVMALLQRTGKFSMIGVSMAGGVSHNFGQLLVAALVVTNARMFVYFPVLVFSGIAAASASASSHISSTASSPHSCSKEAFHERIHHRAPGTNESALYRLVHRPFHRLPRH